MRNTWIIALREWRERIGTRSFILLSFFGPVIVLSIVYALFVFGDQGKQTWKVLIADPTGIMDGKILARENKAVHYLFADNYIEMEEFRDAKQFQSFDALIEINEKVLSNKTLFVFFREKPSVRMQTTIQFNAERRLEEVLVKRFTKLSLSDFRKIKQPLTVAFRNVYDPYDEASDMRGWVGFFYGALIFTFIFLFGMTILRSVSREKSNRIVEVLLGSVHPNQLMAGKIIGIGMAAFFQFIIWMVVVGAGLYVMRETLFPNLLDAANLDFTQAAVSIKEQAYLNELLTGRAYNEFVNLVYERVQFGTMTSFFTAFFLVGYLFYGAFFAAIGATAGSESDGQQFVLPIVFILCFALFAGYYSLQNPESGFAAFFHYFPFTSPVVVMVKLAQGYAPNEGYEIYLSLFTLLVSAFLTLLFAGRLYKNGILQFGHRIGLKRLFTWLRKN